MESVQSANVDTAKYFTSKNPNWNCSDFLLKMLEEGVHADITLNAKGASVKVHKSVLASVSPVFNAMFRHDMKEQLTSTVDIPDMSIEALQLFLLFLYTTNKVGGEDVAGSIQMAYISDIDCKAVLAYKVPHFSGAIDKHFDELSKAILKYQVESRLGYVLLSALARNLTPENCWYYRDSLLMAAPGPFKISAYRVCFNYILGNYHDVIKSKGFLEEMRCNPDQVHMFIVEAENRGLRKVALEDYLGIKRLLCG